MVQPITGQRDPAAKARPKTVDSPPRFGEAIPTSDGDPADSGKIAGGRPDSDFPDAKPEEQATAGQTVGGQKAEPAVDARGKVGDPNKPAVGQAGATPTSPMPKSTTPAAGAPVARKPVRPL
jgi:hypothetical protein